MPVNPDFILCVPTVGARNFVFRLLNNVRTARRFELLVLPGPESVAAKWNRGVDRMLELDVPGVFANDDVVPWPDAIDRLLDACEDGPGFVTGTTVRENPAEVEVDDPGEHEVLASGGFALFALRPEAVLFLEDWERVNWPGEAWPGHRPGRFDECFDPAYFEDFDYYHRLTRLAGLPEEVCEEVRFYHQLNPDPANACEHVGWSTTFHDERRRRRHEMLWAAQRARYVRKWGGPQHRELYSAPFRPDAPAIWHWLADDERDDPCEVEGCGSRAEKIDLVGRRRRCSAHAEGVAP